MITWIVMFNFIEQIVLVCLSFFIQMKVTNCEVYKSLSIVALLSNDY